MDPSSRFWYGTYSLVGRFSPRSRDTRRLCDAVEVCSFGSLASDTLRIPTRHRSDRTIEYVQTQSVSNNWITRLAFDSWNIISPGHCNVNPPWLFSLSLICMKMRETLLMLPPTAPLDLSKLGKNLSRKIFLILHPDMISRLIWNMRLICYTSLKTMLGSLP